MTCISCKQIVLAETKLQIKRKKMKNRLTRLGAGTLLALMMFLGMTQIFVSGKQKESDTAAPPNADFPRSLEGVWRTTVTQRNCQTGAVIKIAQGIVAYHKGGTMDESSNALGPAFRSPGFGVWEKVGPSTYWASFIFQRYSPADGTFAGTQVITSTIEVGAGRHGEPNTSTIDVGGGRFGDPNTYETTTSIQIYDVNNNLLGTGCATATAVRFE
jgi:hypothetical protein